MLRLAPSAARALLAAERPLPAARWFSLLSDECGRRQRSAREDARGLTPLFALAGFGGSDAVPELDSEAHRGLARRRRPSAEAKAERLFALLEGVGVAGARHGLAAASSQPPLPGPRPSVPASARCGAGSSAPRRRARLGETVLLALHMLNGAPAGRASRGADRRACARCATVGLDQEARAIAVATALAMGL